MEMAVPYRKCQPLLQGLRTQNPLKRPYNPGPVPH